MLIVAYGGGTDSTAMVIKLLSLDEKIDYITFCDTGGEKPHTYKYIEYFDKWLKANHGITITMLKKDSIYSSLEDNCLKKKMLPSLAYGYKSCSDKYKIQPQDKFFNNLPAAKAEWNAGRKIIKCIGYDLDEERRAKNYQSDKYINRYPLIEWEMQREDCMEVIKKAGLEQPGKSSCFFCPASKKQEIIELRNTYPDLFARALTMEQQANLTIIKGLGRNFSWREMIDAHDKQLDFFTFDQVEVPCEGGCNT